VPTSEKPLSLLTATRASLRDTGPVGLVLTPAGDEAWLVTRHAEVKALLHDERLGRSHPDPAAAPKYVKNDLLAMLITPDAEAARQMHARARTLLTPHFSARRVRDLKPRIEALTDAMLDRFTTDEPPADLHAGFSLPLSLQILCELLGVPADERHRCAELLARAGQVGTDGSGGPAALFAMLTELADRKRDDPGDDVVSRLATSGIPDEQTGSLAATLLFAGLDAVATHIDLGVVLLTEHGGQRDEVLADPDRLGGMVDEVLRTAKQSGAILPRYATGDIEIAGVRISAGDLVLLDFALANFDERVFGEPDRFDVTRSPNPHLTFGHGIWHCIGAPLARVELATAFTRLYERMPRLRPAVPVEQLTARDGQLVHGLAELPVTW